MILNTEWSIERLQEWFYWPSLKVVNGPILWTFCFAIVSTFKWNPAWMNPSPSLSLTDDRSHTDQGDCMNGVKTSNPSNLSCSLLHACHSTPEIPNHACLSQRLQLFPRNFTNSYNSHPRNRHKHRGNKLFNTTCLIQNMANTNATFIL